MNDILMTPCTEPGRWFDPLGPGPDAPDEAVQEFLEHAEHCPLHSVLLEHQDEYVNGLMQLAYGRRMRDISKT